MVWKRSPWTIVMLAAVLLTVVSGAVTQVLVTHRGRGAASGSGGAPRAWDPATLRRGLPGLLVVRDEFAELRVVDDGGPKKEMPLWSAPGGHSVRLLTADEAQGRIALVLEAAPVTGTVSSDTTETTLPLEQEVVVLEADGSASRHPVPDDAGRVTSAAFSGRDLLVASAGSATSSSRPAGKQYRIREGGRGVEVIKVGGARGPSVVSLRQLRGGTAAAVFSPMHVGSPSVVELKAAGGSYEPSGSPYVGQSIEEPWDDVMSAVAGPKPGTVAFLQRHIEGTSKVVFDVATAPLDSAAGPPRTIAHNVAVEKGSPKEGLRRPMLGAGPAGSLLLAVEEGEWLARQADGRPVQVTYRLDRIAVADGSVTKLRVWIDQHFTRTGTTSDTWLWLDSFGGVSQGTGR